MNYAVKYIYVAIDPIIKVICTLQCHIMHQLASAVARYVHFIFNTQWLLTPTRYQ